MSRKLIAAAIVIMLLGASSAQAAVTPVPTTVPDAVDGVRAPDGTFYVLSQDPDTGYPLITHLAEDGSVADSWGLGPDDRATGFPPRALDIRGEELYLATPRGVTVFSMTGSVERVCEVTDAVVTGLAVNASGVYLSWGKAGGQLLARVTEPGPAPTDPEAGTPDCIVQGNEIGLPGATHLAASNSTLYAQMPTAIMPFPLLDGEIVSNDPPLDFIASDIAVDSQERLYAGSLENNLVHRFADDLDFPYYQPHGLGAAIDGDIVAVGPPEPPPAPEPQQVQALNQSQVCPSSGEPGVTINEGAQFTNDPNVTVTVEPPFCATSIVASNDGGFLSPTSLEPTKQFSWTLDSSGAERLPKTLYIRFKGAGESPTLTDDIILDQTAPVIKEAEAEEPAPPAEASAARVSTARLSKLHLKARDNASGISRFQVKGQKPRKYKTIIRLRLKPKAFVRVFDKAGNASRWKKVTVK